MKDMNKLELAKLNWRLMAENQQLKGELKRARARHCCLCALVDCVEAWMDRHVGKEAQERA